MMMHHMDCGFSRAKNHNATYSKVKEGLGGDVSVGFLLCRFWRGLRGVLERMWSC